MDSFLVIEIYNVKVVTEDFLLSAIHGVTDKESKTKISDLLLRFFLSSFKFPWWSSDTSAKEYSFVVKWLGTE